MHNALSSKITFLYSTPIAKPIRTSNPVQRVMARACYSSKTWVTFEGEQTFYVRNGNQTIALRGSDVDEYWEDRER